MRETKEKYNYKVGFERGFKMGYTKGLEACVETVQRISSPTPIQIHFAPQENTVHLTAQGETFEQWYSREYKNYGFQDQIDESKIYGAAKKAWKAALKSQSPKTEEPSETCKNWKCGQMCYTVSTLYKCGNNPCLVKLSNSQPY